MRTLRFLRSGLVAAVILAQTPQPAPYTFLRKQLAFTPAELIALENSKIIVKLPKTPETREVAAFAIMRLDIPADFLVERVRDITNFKKSENVLQIGKFSNPPRLEDLAGLTFDQVDIDAVRACRVKNCDIKLPAKYIERFQKEVNWSATNHRDRVTELLREMLLEHVQAYAKWGNAALGKYEDKSYPLILADEFKSLLKPAAYMYGYAPEFQKYLEEYPQGRPDNAAVSEDFFYWSKEDFGLKPVTTVTHVTIYKRSHDKASDLIIASKGIYGSHYFESSLGLTVFLQAQNTDQPRTYLIYMNRSRTDALRGFFAGLKRSLIGGNLRDAAKKNMEMMKVKLETEYQKK
jgi:hypothetical protein